MATDLHVERLGNGDDPVVFVHGSGDTGASSFREQFVLAGTFELAILDRRGFGASPPTPRVDWALTPTTSPTFSTIGRRTS